MKTTTSTRNSSRTQKLDTARPAGRSADCNGRSPASRRTTRIAAIRQRIQEGTYETPEKLHTALERMIAEIAGE